ncbi:type II toxin-antitoxin system RelE/ParE family toxin [Microcoleus sp. Pol14C2]|uniref:type II toxin-antitoxin system RelE/ParE family toxin n=1 Tax=unclassified Microcoleus TaxID=2642155 RepID=UPI002FCE959C
MTPKFRLTEPGIQDIEQIVDYIPRQSGLDIADRFLSKIDAKFAKIAHFPNLNDNETKFYQVYAVSRWITILYSICGSDRI